MIKIDNEKVGDEVTNIILEQVDNRYWQKKKKNNSHMQTTRLQTLSL